MDSDLEKIRRQLPTVLADLEGSVFAAAKEVRALGRICSDEYADAILDQNGFGSDTAEVYFYRYAPEGSPQPSDRQAFEAFMSNVARKEEYARACYRGWKEEVLATQAIVGKYGGKIGIVSDRSSPPCPLDYSLEQFDRHYVSPALPAWDMFGHRLHVKVEFPGHEKLRKLREITKE